VFTGLISNVGILCRIETRGNGARIHVRPTEPWPGPLTIGESVSVQGICLTVTSCAGEVFTCDVLHETLDTCSLGAKREGALLNLERALRVGDRLGGHFVTGHVDGTGIVKAVTSIGEDHLLDVMCDRRMLAAMVEKGSVACDGVSLTISRLDADGFGVCLIPETWHRTSLHALRRGETVNIETDLLAKHILKSLSSTTQACRRLTMEDLQSAGFLQ
jgi:riboflavin synthase